ncbi:MAG: 1-phosphofructokinase [Candidatus Tokpelaia sp. JSC189]|nr:MAG: 1-phosphofructokinase [Candidatus Tokpelaia sp. JSC189]
MMKVATVTVNPAIDETVTLQQLIAGEVHRASSVRFDVGGKGINVAACLADFGLDVTATGFLGQNNIRIFEQFFTRRNIKDYFIRRVGSTRTNIKIVDEARTTDINLSGDPVTSQQLQQLADVMDSFCGPQWLVVMAGSLLPHMGSTFYADQVARMANQFKMVVDCSGDGLQAVLKAQRLPYAIKPNIDELSQYCGRFLTDMTEILSIARGLISRGLSLIVVSMGADGALFVTHEMALQARLKTDNIESTVGAGDAMVAGMIAALCENASLDRIARLGTAFAVGKLGLHGPKLPRKDILEYLARAVECRQVA